MQASAYGCNVGEATPKALIALGANLSVGKTTPVENIRRAFVRLREETKAEVTVSQLYRTPAFPPGSGPDFVNSAASLPWSGSAQALLDILHRIEEGFGRTRSARWEARIMDLDLIALGPEIHPDQKTQAAWADLPPDRAASETPDTLILPHPRLAERGFVLVPLAEIAADWVHPISGLTTQQLCAARPAEERAEIWPLSNPETQRKQA